MSSEFPDLIQSVYAYLVSVYGASASGGTQLLLQGIGIPTPSSEFKLHPTDASYSPALAVEVFSGIVNNVSVASGIIAQQTGRDVDDLYEMMLTDALPTAEDTAEIAQFAQVKSAAESLFAPTLGSLIGAFQFHPAYPNPTDWYDPASPDNWTSYSSSPSPPEPPGPPTNLTATIDALTATVSSSLNWELAAAANGGSTAATATITSTGFALSFDYGFVQAERPWLSQSFINTLSWYVPGRRVGDISSGSALDSLALLPYLPIALVVIKNLKITANWSPQDAQLASGAQALGPFGLQQSTFDKVSLSSAGCQIIAWVCEPLPVLPPSSDPTLPDLTITSQMSDDTTDYGGPPFCNYSVTISNVALVITVKSGGQLTLSLTCTMVEQVLGNCPYAPIPTNTHHYSGVGALSVVSVAETLNAAASNQPQCTAQVQGTVSAGRFVGTVDIKRVDQQGSLAWATRHYMPPGAKPSTIAAIQYRPTDPNPGMPDMGVLVTRTSLNGEFHFKVQFTAPAPIPPASFFTQLMVYGFQILANGTRTDLPSGTFPQIAGNWTAGDAITFQFDAPKQFCDPGQGWHIHFEMWTGSAGIPSPNLLSGAPA
jgi:hypothetical protein